MQKRGKYFIVFVLCLALIVMLFIPIISIYGETFNSLFSGFKYSYLSAGFYLFYIIPIVTILLVIFSILSLWKNPKLFGELTGWTGLAHFFVILFALAIFQGFEGNNVNLDVEVEYLNLVIFLLIGIVLTVYELFICTKEYDKDAETEYEKMENPQFKKLLVNKKIKFKETILLNPKWYDTLRHPYPKMLAVSKDEIIISSQQNIRIPFNQIKKVSMNLIFHMAFRIKLNNGKIYKIMWAPVHKVAPYNWQATRALYKRIKEEVKK